MEKRTSLENIFRRLASHQNQGQNFLTPEQFIQNFFPETKSTNFDTKTFEIFCSTVDLRKNQSSSRFSLFFRRKFLTNSPTTLFYSFHWKFIELNPTLRGNSLFFSTFGLPIFINDRSFRTKKIGKTPSTPKQIFWFKSSPFATFSIRINEILFTEFLEWSKTKKNIEKSRISTIRATSKTIDNNQKLWLTEFFSSGNDQRSKIPNPITETFRSCESSSKTFLQRNNESVSRRRHSYLIFPLRGLTERQIKQNYRIDRSSQ